MTCIMDEFKTINSPNRASIKVKGSTFTAYLLPVQSKESFMAQLDFLKSQEKGANHYCWAYRINPLSPEERGNDDGEPSNTAGAPILRVLKSNDLWNSAIVVVRYFGGTKLGVPGLISAYGDAASETLSSATIIRQTITKTFKVNFEYAQISFVERICKIENLEVIDREQGVKLSYTISVIQSKFEEIKEQFESNHLLTVTH